MADDEAFADRQELQDFMNLLMRPEEGGTVQANDWARGFMRGVRMHHESWRENCSTTKNMEVH